MRSNDAMCVCVLFCVISLYNMTMRKTEQKHYECPVGNDFKYCAETNCKYWSYWKNNCNYVERKEEEQYQMDIEAKKRRANASANLRRKANLLSNAEEETEIFEDMALFSKNKKAGQRKCLR